MAEGQLFMLAAVLVAAIAALTDWRTGHIPNWLTLGALGAAPLAHAGTAIVQGRSHEAVQSAGWSVVGALVCVAVPVILYKMRGIYGGDVKLLAAIGALCGPMVGLEAELLSFVVGSVLGFGRLAWDGKLLRSLGNVVVIATNPFRGKPSRREIAPEMLTEMRFGPAIFVGTAMAALAHWRPV